MEAQIAALRVEFEAEHAEQAKTSGQDQTRARVLAANRVEMGRMRQGDTAAPRETRKHK